MQNPIKNRFFPISELKKSPMTLIDKAKEVSEGIYVCNNNNPVAVILDSGTYEDFVVQQIELEEENDRLREELDYLKIRVRLLTNTELYTDEEVRGVAAQSDLSAISDEWSNP